VLVLSSVRRTLEPESARGLRLAELAKQFDAEQVAADARSLAEGVSLIHFATIKVFKSDSEGADPPRFSPEPTCHVFGSNLVANCAEYYGSAGSSGY
jgi:hypothetical protein